MNRSTASGVVVGIDGSPSAEEALDWAAAEAALRGVPLHIAHSWNLAPYRLPEAVSGDIAKSVLESADELLHQAERRVRERHPGIEATIEVLSDEPVPGLMRLAEHADLMVVGSRGLSRFSSVLIGSVSQILVAHANCPVVVLRGTPVDDTLTGTGVPASVTGPGPVVLGADLGEAPGPVAFAFAEAARRGVSLLVVRTWQYPTNYGGYIPFPMDDMSQRDREESEELAQVLAASREEYPGVPLLQEVGPGEPSGHLVDASKGACLVVVGARRRRHRFAMPVGAVTQRVLHHAHCPVAVVPHET